MARKKITHDHHVTPVTRRDFLSQGFLSFAGLTVLPSWLSPLAFGDDCPMPQLSTLPFLVIDAAGGAALPANFLAKNEKNDLLPEYTLLGWNPRESGAISEDLGAPMAAKASKLFEGINQTASAEARKNFRLATICHSAQSDSSSNLLSALGWVVKSGNKGLSLRSAVGTSNTLSGGNSSVAGGTDFTKPLFVRSLRDLTGSVGFGKEAPLGTASTDQLKGLLKMSAGLTEAELEKWMSLPEGKKLALNAKCAYVENGQNATGGDAFDPRKDANFQTIYQINQNTPENSQNVVFASLVKGTLSGQTGPSALTIGGCDYHDNTSETGDKKDNEIGQAIGRAVQAAHILKRPLFIQLITDGGCSNNPGTRIWRSDDNDRCLTVVGYYRPEGAMNLVRTQVGYYNAGQSANLETLSGLGAKVNKVAAVTFANYLRLLNPTENMSDFKAKLDKVVPSDMFKDAKELESCMFFS